MTFRNAEESHAHSLETLNALYEYDDFMLSIQTLADLGCGTGLDLAWWATRTTRDENPEPLNIRCTGFEQSDSFKQSNLPKCISFQFGNFEDSTIFPKKRKFDVLWCHDAFQYCINPLETLKLWNNCTNVNGVIVIIVPQTQNIKNKNLNFYQPNGCYYHYTMPTLIHMLAVNGWDCRDGFFKQKITDPWLYAIAYKSTHTPMDPRVTSWYELAEKNLLPVSAVDSINRHGYLNQQDLVLPWIDKNFCTFSNL